VTNDILTIVVDDDPSVCSALRRLLQTAAMEVETFISAEEFLRSTLGRDPDCLVLDIRMPGMTGPELRDRLRAMGRYIPIVFITAHAEEEDGAAGDHAVVLHKPFDDQALLDAIRRAVTTGSN
jgi:FixJ family two-component response regulator